MVVLVWMIRGEIIDLLDTATVSVVRTGIRTRRWLPWPTDRHPVDATVKRRWWRRRWRCHACRLVVVVVTWRLSVAARGQHAPTQLEGCRRSAIGTRRARLYRHRRHQHDPQLVRLSAQLVAGSRRRIPFPVHVSICDAGWWSTSETSYTGPIPNCPCPAIFLITLCILCSFCDNTPNAGFILKDALGSLVSGQTFPGQVPPRTDTHAVWGQLSGGRLFYLQATFSVKA